MSEEAADATTHAIFVDSSIPVYVIGGDHPDRDIARRLLSEAVLMRRRLVTDAEVLQEILHRYVAIRRRDAIDPAFTLMLAIVDEVLPVERFDIERARRIVMTSDSLSARDAVHVAVMQRHGIGSVMSFDAGFDGVAGLTRLA